MKVRDLIEELENFAGDDMEVRLAQQPRRPLEFGVGEVVCVDDVVYVGEGYQHGYLPGDARSELGW